MTTGIIMAAGKGSRMQPLTNHTPKPLAKIGNQTLLEINMHRLAPLVDSFVIVVYYLADQIEKYIGDTFEGKPVHYAHASGATTGTDRKSTRLNSSHVSQSRMPSSA